MAIYSNINTASRSRQRSSNSSKNYDNISKDIEELIKIEAKMRKENKDDYAKACNPNSSIETLRYLSHHSYDPIRLAAARNPSCTHELLLEFADSIFYDVRKEVAKRKDCPLDILIKLCRNSSHEVVETALKHPTLIEEAHRNPDFPIDILVKMISDRKIYLKLFNIAKNPNTSKKTLKQLIGVDYDINFCIIANPNCPIEVLVYFLNYKDKEIKKSVIETLKARASNPKTTVEDLETLSEINILGVKLAVANNPNCSDSILMSLKDKSLLFSKNTKKRLNDLKVKNKKFKTMTKSEEIKIEPDKIEQSKNDEDDFAPKM